MQTAEFLARILPPPSDTPEGWYCWATPSQKGDGFHQRFTRTADKLAASVLAVDQSLKVNTYFAMASFKQAINRKHANVAYIKSFWLDIDCGPAKAEAGTGYATKREGLDAAFWAIKDAGLPTPLVVDSGNGLHLYWPLTEAVDAETWRPVAYQLVQAMRERDLIADFACSADMSRILRPPGTHNWKDAANPKPVRVLHAPAEDYTFERIATPLEGYAQAARPSKDVTTLVLNSDLALPAQGPTSRADIVASNCLQMRHFRDSQGVVEYPVWYANLAVLKACVDGEEAAHAWSSGHPTYSREETERKLNDTRGPTTCAHFERINKTLCNNCVFLGKITSPIQVGDPERESEVPESIAEDEDSSDANDDDEEGSTVSSLNPTIPSMPELLKVAGFRYRRGELQARETEDGDVRWTPFTETLLWMDRISRGDATKARVHALQRDQRIESFDLPTDLLWDRQALMKFLTGRHNVSAYHGTEKHMHAYLHKWYEEARKRAEETRLHTHFGWQESGGFLLGERLYRPDGSTQAATLGADASKYAQALQMRGKASEWTRIVNTAYNKPGMEQFQFIIAAGFGAPLMRFTETAVHGVVVDMVSEASGRGKTTVARCALAIYGQPLGLSVSWDRTTTNALYQRIGIMHSLPCYVDEITDAKAAQLGAFAYDVSSGQPKERVGRSGESKDLKESWRTIVMASGNSSLYSKLASAKERADAQMLRVLEYRFDNKHSMTPDAARMLFNGIDHNYGTAGDVYIKYLVSHVDEVQDVVSRVYEQVQARAGIQGDERYWSAGIAASIAGAFIAKSLRLIDFDVKALLAWCVNRIKELRQDRRDNSSTGVDSWNAMLDEYARNGFVVTDSRGDSKTEQYVERTGNQSVVGRLIKDEGRAWITVRAVQRWCNDHNADMKEVVAAAQAAGIIATGTVMFPLGVGTTLVLGTNKCFEILMSKLQLEPE
jgi:hypothetical protein